MVICKKCGNRAPSSSMKLDLDEKLIICQECIKNKKVHKEIKEKIFHQANNNIQEVQQENVKKFAHKCTSCGFKFMINPETKTPRNCPYCNAKVMVF